MSQTELAPAPGATRPLVAAAPPASPARPRVLMIGSALSSAATFMFFMGMLGIYLARRADAIGAGKRWLPKSATIPLTQPNMIFFTMIMTCVTFAWASYALRRRDKNNAFIALGLTLLFSVAIINQYTYLLSQLNLSVKTEAGVLVLAICGAHVVMLLLITGALLLVTLRTLGGSYRDIPEGITATAVWWYTAVAIFAALWYGIFITK